MKFIKFIVYWLLYLLIALFIVTLGTVALAYIMPIIHKALGL